jgi:short-subunit dehydrogenase
MPVWSAYCSSKHALESFSECMRYELAQFGVSVVVVKPGPVATPLWAKGRARSTTEVDPQLFAASKEVYGAMIDGVSWGRDVASCKSRCWEDAV